MPRVVDHDQRRAEIGAAVMRLVARRGIEAVTVREVAAESGWSTGVLAHYFRSKEDMLVFAFQATVDSYRRRVEALPTEAGPAAFLREALAGLLPLDETRRDEMLVWFSFVGRLPGSEHLRRLMRDCYRELSAFLARVIEAGQQAGEFRGEIVPADEARSLMAFCDGMAMQHIYEPGDVSQADLRRLLDERLTQLRIQAD